MRPDTSLGGSGLASGVAGSRQVVSLWQLLNKTYVGFRVFNFIYKNDLNAVKPAHLWSGEVLRQDHPYCFSLEAKTGPEGLGGTRAAAYAAGLACCTRISTKYADWFTTGCVLVAIVVQNLCWTSRV